MAIGDNYSTGSEGKKTAHMACVTIIKPRWRMACACVVIWYFALAVHGQGVRGGLRSASVADVLKLESLSRIDPVELSADGRSFAYVRRRALRPGNVFGPGDVWVASVESGAPTNLTKGEADDRSCSDPKWSPDGTRLAMRCSGKNEPTLWIWEKSTERLRQLNERGTANEYGSFVWVSNKWLAAALIPKGEIRVSVVGTDAIRRATREWKNYLAGKPTQNALESGVRADLGQRSQQELTLIDVESGAARSIATAPLFADKKTSPDNRALAFLKQVGVRLPNLVSSLSSGVFDRIVCQLEIADVAGDITSSTAKSPASSVFPDSFRWAPNSQEFAFIGTAGDDDLSAKVFRGIIGGAIVAVPVPRDGVPRGVVWTSDNRLVMSVEHRNRPDWWLVSRNGTLSNITDHLTSVPPLSGSNGRAIVGAASGDLWRLDIPSDSLKNVTMGLNLRIGNIVWQEDNPGSDGVVVVSVPQGPLNNDDFYRVDLTSGAATRLKSPSGQAALAAYSARSDTAIFETEDRTGTYLTILHDETARPVVEMNEFLRDVEQGEVTQIKYRSLDGQQLNSWLVLPAKYHAGKRYPVVAWIYPGDIYGDRMPTATQLNRASALNLQLLAARGYAVLLPSMPLKSQRETAAKQEYYADLTNGVLPALNKLIDLGIADARRLAVMGHSFGGYGTYGLIEQTDRFRAAVALAGPSDLISEYGSYDPITRYSPYSAHEVFLYAQSSFESGQIAMGAPPWKDPAYYIRNSPLFYVDRVQTPLLIVQGDNDNHVPITQTEELFAALYRLGKRARFLRYWGERHQLTSPENIRDFWHETYAWLDQFCDISRDDKGDLVFDGDHVKSRNGAPALKPEDFARFGEIEQQSHPLVKNPASSAQ